VSLVYKTKRTIRNVLESIYRILSLFFLLFFFFGLIALQKLKEKHLISKALPEKDNKIKR